MTHEGKHTVALLFGGKSVEHEVSLQSAKNVYAALDKTKYQVMLIGIDKEGVWHLVPERYLLDSSMEHEQAFPSDAVSLVVEHDGTHLLHLAKQEKLGKIDIVFPVLHGTYGEDGSMQGLLKLLGLPFVGSGVLGSAIGMDKDVSKRLLRDAGFPVAQFLVYRKGEDVDFSVVSQKLGLPLFVKPANLGSSVGISKVDTAETFAQAIQAAFAYDTKIILEEALQGREIECSVLGNDDVQASLPGEIIASHTFYDYGAKYLDENGARLTIPADLTPEQRKEVQSMACNVFKVLCLDGMARIDFFLTTDGELYVNEANTLPGFTNISMYPKLWEASGIGYKELIEKLLQLAIEKHREQQQLKTTV